MLAAGTITAPDLLEIYLDRIAPPRPRAAVVPRRARRLRPQEAGAAQDRLNAGERLPLLGVPIAIKDDVDVAGEVTTYGTAAYGPAPAHDAEVVRQAARGRRGHHRQDRRARDDDLVVHRDGHVRRDAQPVEHRLRAGRQQRWQRRRGRGRPGGDGAGIRRHGFDPDPVDVVRPVRDQAAAGPGAAGAARRRVERAQRERADGEDRRGRRAVPRRDAPRTAVSSRRQRESRAGYGLR